MQKIFKGSDHVNEEMMAAWLLERFHGIKLTMAEKSRGNDRAFILRNSDCNEGLCSLKVMWKERINHKEAIHAVRYPDWFTRELMHMLSSMREGKHVRERMSVTLYNNDTRERLTMTGEELFERARGGYRGDVY